MDGRARSPVPNKRPAPDGVTLTEFVNRFPPARCRLLARSGTRPLSNSDISMRSGLSRAVVCKLSHLRNWNNVKLKTIEAFASGCGINLMSPHKRRDNRLVHQGKMEFMKRSAPSQRRMYKRLITDLWSGPRDARGPLE